MFYNLGEGKFSKGQADEAATWYQKASDLDPSWGKPIFKLALVQLNKGDKDATIKALDKVIAADPTSQEAAQAKTVIEQLKKREYSNGHTIGERYRLKALLGVGS